ncbi:pseudouridine synthase [Roseibium sp.]|uniref:pseudouridine synthase n=1 Tax=Roseibium sp. TaxID=1936156 RepID=UPI003A96C841
MTTEQPPKKRRGPAKAGGATKRFSGKRSDERKDAGRAPRSFGDKPGGGKGKFAPRKDRDGNTKPGKFAGKGRRDTDRRSRPQDEARGDEGGFNLEKGERIAKVMARAGLCSRREAETWVTDGRVEVNGKTLETPAVTVTNADDVKVDGQPLPLRERTRLWLYYKPRGLVTTNHDPEGRPTVFDRLPDELPRVLTVGRLDINTEGLLLLTNDGGLARVLELPATGWLRRYRVRAFGKVTQEQLNTLADGVAIDGVLYGAIEATLDKEQGDNVWLTVGLREGKNREVKRVLEHLGLAVNRLIRLSFGPFQLMDLQEGGVREIRGRVLRDQLGEKLAEEAGADFDAPIFNEAKPEAEKESRGGGRKAAAGGQKAAKGSWMTAREGQAAKAGRKPSGAPRRDDDGDRGERREREDRDGQQNRRRNAGDRQVKVSPRSRFRMTSEPRPRLANDTEERRPLRQRRIWGDEGLVEDKQQERRAGRDKGGDRPRSDRPRSSGPRSDRPRSDRSGSDRPGSDRPRGPRRGDRS